VLIAAVIVAGCAAPALAQNLLRNGGFEAPVAGDAPQGWSFHNFHGNDFAKGEVVKKQTAFGKYALLLRAPTFPADFTAFCLPVNVQDLVSDEILFSCSYRTEEHPQALLTLAAYGEDFTIREFSTPELHSESHPIGETATWRSFSTRMRVPDGALQVVAFLRVMGGGRAWWDGVSLRPVGGEIEADLTQTGEVERIPDRRALVCHVRNVTDREMPVRLEMEATQEGKKRVIRANASCQLAPGAQRDLTISYPFAFDTPHHLSITLLGDEPDVIHAVWERDVPGLVDARVTSPAFRSMILSTIPTENVTVEGTINAVPEIARAVQLDAMIVGTGEAASDLQFLTDDGICGPWRLELPATGMLTQQYIVHVTASVSGKEQTIGLPVTRAPIAQAETGYDARGRLWVNGEPIFPIGIHQVAQESDLPVVAQAGINFVITPSRLLSFRYANAAREAGTHVILASDTLDGQFWEYMSRKYYGHPAMIGWSGIELPDTKLVQYATLEQAYRAASSGPYPAIAQADIHHPIYLALRPNSLLPQFAQLADVVMAWSDPVPREPLTAVADAVYAAREAVGDRKPVWAIVQSSGYRWASELSPTPAPDGRAPTAAENRAMVYLALMAGADGIIYHAWGLPSIGQRPSYRIARDEPELWTGIVETNRQLEWLAPALLAGDPEPIALPYDSPVQMAAWQRGDARIVVAVNVADTTAAIAFDIGAAADEEVEVLFEDRSVIATDRGELGDIFAPYAVHIYQIGA